MIFGDAVEAAGSVSPAAWIAGERSGTWGTVGSLIPDRYPSIVRVVAPDPDDDDSVSAYRELFRKIATVGARHTSTPDQAWFAVWEGYGFGTATTMIAWTETPPDRASRRAREAARKQLRRDDLRRNAAIRSELSELTTLELPHREYYLLGGPVTAATELRDPNGRPGGWQRPDLFWPDDRRWFVATDVDFWSLYIGGDNALVAEILDTVPNQAETTRPDDHLVVEK